MIRLVDWMERSWLFELPIGAFPAVLDRLRGTPVRAEELVAGASEGLLCTRVGGCWSVNEHLGHLDDLNELDSRRLGEFLARAPALSAADVENRRTEAASHNAIPVGEILARFRSHRSELVAALEKLETSDIAASSVHPRLQRAMRLIDWTQFVADHDDHHLARAREVLRSLRGDPGPTDRSGGFS